MGRSCGERIARCTSSSAEVGRVLDDADIAKAAATSPAPVRQ